MRFLSGIKPLEIYDDMEVGKMLQKSWHFSAALKVSAIIVVLLIVA
jgi:hypothetical protein